MSFESKFNLFMEAIYNGDKYDLESLRDPGIVAFFKESAVKAGFDKEPVGITLKSGETTEGPTRKLTGYNLYMKTQHPILKAQGIPVREIMAEVGKLWKTLTEDQKKEWKAKAALEPPVPSKARSKNSGPKRPNGYNIYVKEQMPAVKNNPDVAKGTYMAEIGKMWKSLSKPEQQVWKDKAAAMA